MYNTVCASLRKTYDTVCRKTYNNAYALRLKTYNAAYQHCANLYYTVHAALYKLYNAVLPNCTIAPKLRYTKMTQLKVLNIHDKKTNLTLTSNQSVFE